MSVTTSPAARPRPYRLRAPVVPEVDTHAAIAEALDILLLPPAMWTTLPIGHVKLTGQQAARLARVGVKRGWPDILLLHDGRLYGLEIKRTGGALSRTGWCRRARAASAWWRGRRSVFPRLIAAGCRIACVSSVAEALAALAAWSIPTRGVS